MVPHLWLPAHPTGRKIKRRINIRRLNSPLAKFKLVVPYGEYRATYAKGIFRPFPVLFAGTNTHAPRASSARPDAAARHQCVPQRIAGYQQDPLKRPLSDKDKFKQQKELRNELKGPYKKWVDEDVRWIITDQELKAFKSLSNDEERDNFIETVLAAAQPRPRFP